MIDLSVLRGYVLEELLAALLKSSGYDLIVDAVQDPAALIGAGNGLRVRGRGADHQVDVLGQLRARVGVVHPIRLFLEAKCRSAKTGLADVRNALGVVNDVNEDYSWAAARASFHPYARYQYRYALFSTSGFTSDAQRYAITQQITLVDLSPPGLRWIYELADRVAVALESDLLRTPGRVIQSGPDRGYDTRILQPCKGFFVLRHAHLIGGSTCRAAGARTERMG